MDVASEHRTVEVRPEHLERAINFFRQHPELYLTGRARGCLMNQALRDAFPVLHGKPAKSPDNADSRYSCGASWWTDLGTEPDGRDTYITYLFDRRGMSLVRAFDGRLRDLLERGPEAFPIPLPVSVELTVRAKDSDDE